jgi:hypothetical protein
VTVQRERERERTTRGGRGGKKIEKKREKIPRHSRKQTGRKSENKEKRGRGERQRSDSFHYTQAYDAKTVSNMVAKPFVIYVNQPCNNHLNYILYCIH